MNRCRCDPPCNRGKKYEAPRKKGERGKHNQWRQYSSSSDSSDSSDSDSFDSDSTSSDEQCCGCSKDALLPQRLRNQKYVPSEVLGKGAFGVVLKAVSKQGDRPTLAVKKMERKSSTLDKHTKAEIRIILAISHPFIVKCCFVEKSCKAIYIVMECANRGDLQKYIHSNDLLPEKTAKTLFLQVALAIKYLHSEDIMHRDLKPANILLHKSEDDMKLRIKVSDFGLSKESIITGKHTICGTPLYMAPEVKSGMKYSCKADVWSLGFVQCFILTKGKLPKIEIVGNKIRGPSTIDASKEANDLLRQMLKPDHSERIDAKKIPEHDWIAKDPKVLKIVNGLL